MYSIIVKLAHTILWSVGIIIIIMVCKILTYLKLSNIKVSDIYDCTSKFSNRTSILSNSAVTNH